MAAGTRPPDVPQAGSDRQAVDLKLMNPRPRTGRGPRSDNGCLLCLKAVHVCNQVTDPLLNLRFMSLADTREQWTPDRHVLAAVRGIRRLSSDHGGDMRSGIFAAIIF